MRDRCDLEPVFFAPFVSSLMRVEAGWIDYNGHLNMAYYNILFDRAVDELRTRLGHGTSWPALFRPSTYCLTHAKTWMPGPRPGMARFTPPYSAGRVPSLA